MITTLLVDDESLIRAGLRFIIESAPDLTVAAEVEDGDLAVAAVRRTRPDVVLMDVRMPRLDGLAATEAVRALPDAPAVIVLTTFDTDDYVFRALEAGACGFLLKDTSPQDLIRAIRLAHAGDAMLSPRVTGRLIHRFTDTRARGRREALARLEGLTAREREVLVEVGLGPVERRDRRRPAHERGHGEEPRFAPVRQARRRQSCAGGHRRVSRRLGGLTP